MAALLIPYGRGVAQHLGQSQPLRLPPVEDRLDDVRARQVSGSSR
jgi:hypothetical protein